MGGMCSMWLVVEWLLWLVELLWLVVEWLFLEKRTIMVKHSFLNDYIMVIISIEIDF